MFAIIVYNFKFLRKKYYYTADAVRDTGAGQEGGGGGSPSQHSQIFAARSCTT